jgi:hypothetical protein
LFEPVFIVTGIKVESNNTCFQKKKRRKKSELENVLVLIIDEELICLKSGTRRG